MTAVFVARVLLFMRLNILVLWKGTAVGGHRYMQAKQRESSTAKQYRHNQAVPESGRTF